MSQANQKTEQKPVMEYQHAEIDNAVQSLRDVRRFLRRFVEEREAVRQSAADTYLRGVHDGVLWGEFEAEGITRYDNYDRLYDPRTITDESLSASLQTVVGEARSENWGNVAVNAEKAARLAWELKGEGRPEVVCLCGSTRFRDEYREQNARLTLEGIIVLSVGFFHHSGDAPPGVSEVVEEFEESETKADLDELHKRKIDLADRVFVVNVDGYVGESTQSEIDYAREQGVPIDWLEEPEEAASDE